MSPNNFNDGNAYDRFVNNDGNASNNDNVDNSNGVRPADSYYD